MRFSLLPFTRRRWLTASWMTLAVSGLKWWQLLPETSANCGGPSTERADQEMPSASPPHSADDFPKFEKALIALYRRVAPSTVNLFAEPGHEHEGSGVVIDEKGYVLTHAHHQLTPGTACSAVFSDGRKVAGKYLGVHEPFDLSLVELQGGGPWPAVPLGDPAGLKPGDLCIMLGYPKFHFREGQPPLLRLGRFAGPWAHFLLTSSNINGGDSGGPLFGLDGRLLGNNNLLPFKDNDKGLIIQQTGHTSVEYFHKIEALLLAGRHVRWEEPRKEPSGRSNYPVVAAFEGVGGKERMANPTHQAVLTVLDGNTPVALGLVVDAAAWAVTKASELPAGKVLCKLADGRKLEAVVAGRDRDHDLALLELSARDLPAAVWAEGPPEVGRVLAALGPQPQPLALGVVASGVRDIPGGQGTLGFEVAAGEPGEAGVRIVSSQKLKPRTAKVLKRGDVITSVEGELTPDPTAFARVIERHTRGADGRPGERLRLTFQRDDREHAATIVVEPANNMWGNPRSDGFPAAFIYDGVVPPSECGAPLVGTDGKVAALVVARIGPAERAILTGGTSRTYAIPAQVVVKVIAELRKKHSPGVNQ
jgi:serine protease Do